MRPGDVLHVAATVCGRRLTSSAHEASTMPCQGVSLRTKEVGMSTFAHPVGTESQQCSETAPQREAVSLLAATKRILEMIAAGAGLADILTNLCVAIDAQSPDMISTVMLMDPDGKRLWPAAGPRVPSGWTRALSPLVIGPNMGSCGTAAFRKGRVIISDMAGDPLLSAVPAESRDIAMAHGIRASWSQPLISKDN